MDTEIWRPVPSHQGLYEVSDQGRVRLTARRISRGPCTFMAKPRLLATTTGGRAGNYLRVHLYNPERFAYIHHLVAEAFLGPRPEGLMVLHKDDNGFDNRLENLRYGDRDENELDRHVARVAADLEAAPF